MVNDSEMLQYVLDLQGYLVVPNVLSNAEVSVLNAIVEEHEAQAPEESLRFGSAPQGSGFLTWGQPFVDLLDHQAIMPLLRLQLGDCFRLDRIYGIHMRPGMARGRLHADYGATSPTSGARPGEYYPFRDNQIYNGFVVVTWNLTDAGPDHGGFCCIPGSHKSNFRLPDQIDKSPETSPYVIIPEAPAGSVVLFTEALTHGTAAWNGPHQRRCLLYKYCVSHIAWTADRVDPPTDMHLSERQQILFRQPADPHRHFPSLFDAA